MNSLHHGFSKEYNGIINIDITKKFNTIYLLYSDNGVGIEEEILPKIFNPFFTTNRSQDNSGLGLNIIYNIVTGQFKGKINCSSTPYDKTTFSIEFPIEE